MQQPIDVQFQLSGSSSIVERRCCLQPRKLSVMSSWWRGGRRPSFDAGGDQRELICSFWREAPYYCITAITFVWRDMREGGSGQQGAYYDESRRPSWFVPPLLWWVTAFPVMLPRGTVNHHPQTHLLGLKFARVIGEIRILLRRTLRINTTLLNSKESKNAFEVSWYVCCANKQISSQTKKDSFMNLMVHRSQRSLHRNAQNMA